jgi:carbamoylphosphate synthase large subunit
MIEEKEKTMYNVTWKDADNVICEQEVEGLTPAMEFAKELNCLVTIKGNGIEVVGLFGADSIKDGMCPDGVAYTWKKRRI